MTIQEAFKKVSNVCHANIQELTTDIERLKDTPQKDLTVSFEHEIQQISKSLRILNEFISNSVDDGK
tara:strand:- start:633 stop:833 length:201 start_codon:yes stop_codon:yes gene_type:complete